MDAFLQQLPFQLDDFQLEAVQAIDAGKSVVVCAPTGAGKTIIAEFAAHVAIDKGLKLFYTTPLKALSNQKYFDFKEKYGEQNVGLLTGDLSINRDARLVVMTTEVFRNMLYGLNEDSGLLNRVGYVVLDECHFMNDAERGTVWEESIIYCPPTIQLIALSATVANAQELTDWINHVHHDTALVHSDFRPVPLRFFYYNRDKIQPLFEAPGRMNQKLKSEQRLPKGSAQKPPSFKPNALIEEMAERDMLPAIFFTFSRRGCDQALKNTRDLKILPPEDRERIERFIADFLVQHPYLEGTPMLDDVRNGFAAHHAGLLPAMKMLVEQLFQQGLIKAIFATETLAAGINMPARSTVITAISKRTNDGHRMLTASEFLQMSGRAGRRGMDTEGNVVIVSSPFRGAKDTAALANAAADPLNSQFTPTYGMVLNLLQKFPLENVQYLVRKSFGQFTAERRLNPLTKELAQKTAELDHYVQFACPDEVMLPDFHGYLKQRSQLLNTHHQRHIIQRQIKRHGNDPQLVAELERLSQERDTLKASMEASPCHPCKLLKEHERNEERIHRLQKYLKSLNTVYDREKDLYWKRFVALMALLIDLGHLDASNPDAPKPTPKGLMTAQIRTENELYVAELILGGVWDGLTPEQLAGVVACLVCDSIKESVVTQCKMSPAVRTAYKKMEKLRKRQEQRQEQAEVHVPIHLFELPGAIVEAWAQGLPWPQLLASSDLDEGTLVRMIRRTVDLLRQFSRIPEIPYEFAATARQAVTAIYRDPIRELELGEEALQAAAESVASPEAIEPLPASVEQLA